MYTWNKRTRLSVIKKGQPLPKTREDLEEYVDKLWLQKGRSPWIRFKAGNKDSKKILHDDLTNWAKREDYTVAKEKIQAKNLSKVGFLMGYHPSALNASNLELALKQFENLKDIQIEVRNEGIQVSKSKPRSTARAPTIWTSWEQAGRCRSAHAKIYSTSNKGAYPLATQARFIPNPLDSRFITSVQARAMAAKAQSKHETFIKKTSTGVGYNIIGLDYYIEDYQVTLRQAIMSIRSASEPDFNLFTAVDDMNYSNNVTFAFRKTLESEALAAIPGLPLILEGHYGPKIWTWFAQSAQDETEGYEWDPEQGLIGKNEVIDYTELAGWEDLEEDIPDSESAPATTVHGFSIVANNLGQNQYQDDGTIKTKHFQTSEQSNLDNPNPENQDPATTITNLLATNPSMSAQLMEFIRKMTAQANQESQAVPQDSTQDETPRGSEDTPAPTVTPTKTPTDDSMDIDQE